ncbi:MAG: DUF4836 family protein [Muribaculaceae bacterium]|nr:DUF4836 family protein [Muribaculaceae bacterium]
MKWFRKLSIALLAVLMTGCASDSLEKMIPADATGVVSLDLPEILKKAGMLNGGNVVLPKSLQQVIDENDTSPLCVILSDLPQLGIDTDSKAYAFFTVKTFGRVLLASLDDPDKACKTLAMRVGGDFSKEEGLNCMYVGDNLYVVDGKVLFIGTVNKSMEISRAAKAAKGILSKTATSVLDNKAVKDVIHNNDAAINAWVQGKGLKTILNKSEVYRELSQKMPLIGIFTESDIDAVTCNIDLDDDEVGMITRIMAAQDSEYAQLLNSTLGKPSGDVLKAIPNSMDQIFTLCVKGDSFVKLKQIQQLLKMFGKLPYIGRIDLASILSTVDGPFTIGLARDPHLEGEWNMVLAARSTDPDGVLKQISSFANSMGQAPELYEGEYIYQYDNKMIRIGVIDGILYFKMLDYEQTEGYAYEMKPVREFFDKALLGVFMQTRGNDVHGFFDFGLQDIFNGKGHFYTNDRGANATLELLRSLCSIKVGDAFGNEDNDEGFSSFMTGAIDQLQPME